MPPGRSISVIVPVLNEEDIINRTLSHIRSLEGGEGVEIIVVDGSSRGGTIKAIEMEDIITLTSAKGRGIQMNAGADKAKGDILVFLHVDTFLPERGLEYMRRSLDDPKISGGAFTLDMYDFDTFLKRLIFLQNLRARITRVPYGDQVIFVRRKDFNEIGGFAPIRLFEDVDLMSRMKRKKMRIDILHLKVRSSGRRFMEKGPIHALARNIFIISLYHIGVSPDRLARFYQR